MPVEKLLKGQSFSNIIHFFSVQIRIKQYIICEFVFNSFFLCRFVLLESSTRTCFTQPPASIQSKRRRLADIYNANLTLEKPEDFVLPSSQDEHEEVHLEKVPEVVAEEVAEEVREEELREVMRGGERINGVEEILQPEEEAIVEEDPKENVRKCLAFIYLFFILKILVCIQRKMNENDKLTLIKTSRNSYIFLLWNLLLFSSFLFLAQNFRFFCIFYLLEMQGLLHN